MFHRFIFATGIENSNPTIDNGSIRMDELEKCLHYAHWKKDFELVKELGINFLRYGPPIHTTFEGPRKYNWHFADETFHGLREKKIVPIVDLCHFGVPGWVGNFQNPDFPVLFAEYANDFSIRFPWVQLYTPVNEMYICALFSAYYGWWNEQLTTDRSFVTALKNIVKANVMAMKAILNDRPDAIFIKASLRNIFMHQILKLSSSAEIMNERRFLSLDLNYGKRIQSEMYEYLMDNDMTKRRVSFLFKK